MSFKHFYKRVNLNLYEHFQGIRLLALLVFEVLLVAYLLGLAFGFGFVHTSINLLITYDNNYPNAYIIPN